MDSVRDKVVLITGASTGIGASTAILYAKYGSRLALTGRNKKNLEEVAGKCEEQGLSKDKILTVLGELADDGDIKRIVDSTVDKFGTIHILVNNAAMTMPGGFMELPVDKLDEVYRVNLRSIFLLTQLVVPHLKKNQGSIVNVSSIFSLRATPQFIGYSMMKAGLDMFTQSTSVELAADNIRVNAVSPGWVNTPIHTKCTTSPEQYEQYMRVARGFHPLQRIAEPEEVAQSIVFLSSDAASFITGVLLPVDGGLKQTASWTYPKEPLL